MAQTGEELTANLAERWCWQVARRDDARVARRVSHQQGVDGVDQLGAGAWLDDFVDVLQELGGRDWLSDVQGTTVQRVRVPVVQDCPARSPEDPVRDRAQAGPAPLALPHEALRRLVGVNARQVRQGGCQLGAAPRPEPHATGPIGPDALADHLVQRHRRAVEAVCNRVIRALAQAGVCAANVAGIVDATDLETTAHDEVCG